MVALSIIMSTLDSSVVNVALPVIRAEFDAGIKLIEWVITSYLLTITAFLMVFGRMADMYGRKRIFMGGIAVFTLSSAACAFSNSIYWLIAARSLQGMGAACLMANGNPIVTEVFPQHQRGRILGLVGTTVAIGLTSGPVLGGVITTYFGWRYIFLFNLPIGALTMYFAQRFLPRGERQKTARFDFSGAAAMTLALISMLLLLTKFEQWGAAVSVILSVFVLSLFYIFILIERKAAAPMIELSLFRDNRFSHANLAAFLNFAARFSVVFLLPFYLMDLRGMLPSQAGILMTPVPLMFALIAPISGSLSDKIGTRLLTTAGMLLTAVGLGMLVLIGESSSIWFILSSLMLMGIGGGLFSSPNVSTIMGSVPLERLGNAGAMTALVRNLGMIVGVAWSAAVFIAVSGHELEFAGSPETFVPAFRVTMIIAMALAFLSALISYIRGEITIHRKPD